MGAETQTALMTAQGSQVKTLRGNEGLARERRGQKEDFCYARSQAFSPSGEAENQLRMGGSGFSIQSRLSPERATR